MKTNETSVFFKQQKLCNQNQNQGSRNYDLLQLMLLFSFFLSSVYAGDIPVIIGTQASGAHHGFSVAQFDTSTGTLTVPRLLEEAAAPAYFVIHPDKKFLYTVNETDTFHNQPSGSVSAYKLDPNTAQLTLLNQKASGGAAPCYISLDGKGRYVFTANYQGGNVSVYALNEDGSLGNRTAFDQHTGSGIVKSRQEKAHAHSIIVDATNKYVLSADLGVDKIYIYRFDENKGTLVPNKQPYVSLKPGSGPRHLVFHPDGKYLFVVNELAGTVTVFAWDSREGTLKELQTISSLPADFKGTNTSAEIKIHPNGRFLYASNRGYNHIAVFSIDPVTRHLTLVEQVSTQGDKPRNFNFDPSGKWMIVTNHDSNNAVVFRVNNETGKLTPNGQPVSVPFPFCVRFVSK